MRLLHCLPQRGLDRLQGIAFQVEFAGVVVGEELGITAQISQPHRSSQMRQRIIVGLTDSD